MDILHVLYVALWTVVTFFLCTSPYWITFICHKLGEYDLFFTLVEEGQVMAVMVNQKFKKCLISKRGCIFRGKNGLTNEEKKSKKEDEIEGDLAIRLGIDEWDIIPGEEIRWYWEIPFIGEMLIGLHWIGFPPFAKVHTFRFNWVTLEYGTDKTQPGKSVPSSRGEEKMDHVLAQDYVYLIKVDDAEDKNLMPLEVSALLTLRTSNPYKAFFGVHNWLETIAGQSGGRMREFVGEKEYTILVTDKGGHSKELRSRFEDLILWFKKDYGQEIVHIQLRDVNPTEAYRKISTKKYEAQQEAVNTILAAEAEQKAIQMTIGEVQKIGGEESVRWYLMGKTKLTTYVEGQSKERVGIILPPGAGVSMEKEETAIAKK